MKKNKIATSVAEAMIVLLVVLTGIVGMYDVYNKSVKLSQDVSDKIIATNIAREGVEIMTNIRDTNWLLFGADYENCWNTLNYDNNCVGGGGAKILTNTSIGYSAYRDSNNRWVLQANTPTANLNQGYSNPDYRNAYGIGIDNMGFYTQSGAVNGFDREYTRNITVNYIDDTGIVTTDPSDGKMLIKSLVEWNKPGGLIGKVEIETILSNWKK